ncbi:CYFA0S03e02982g1_1 [Cyberlindnera fabianii]|uniref:CYFA0S03e02982g1_1 n=1 Tax=Cyberlindnera fabianii TaxID=36022 RepID=A0A061AXH5_CYBFA|nr:Transcription initiation factor TFIID subunit 11 [Cyberlindnera fabianii]CDR39407.1 CYFA0S03e02982g1_1 [Cyberlindnera fabianii]
MSETTENKVEKHPTTEQTLSTTSKPVEENNESDLDLSDVPMDEHSLSDDSDNSDFEAALEDEESYILNKIFKSVHDLRASSDGVNDDEAEEPEEELDEEERLRLLMEHLDPVQMSRYEYFKRTGINRGSVKKLAYAVLNQSVSNNVAIIVSGVSKVFVGEIVEKARQVQERYNKADYLIKLKEKKELSVLLKKEQKLLKEAEQKQESVDTTPIISRIMTLKEEIKKMDLRNINEHAPLQPEHIREAWRLYQIENHSVPGHQWRQQGERDGMMFR